MSEKFILATDEKLYKEGSASSVKSIINVLQGHTYLTSKRLVFCSRGWLLNSAFGAIISLVVKSTSIEFEMSLAELMSITKESHGFTSKYSFKASTGPFISILFTTGSEKWVEAIIAAKEASNPSIKTVRIGDLIEFKES